MLPEETLGVDAAGRLFANHQSHVEWRLNSIQPIPLLIMRSSHTPTGMVCALKDWGMNRVEADVHGLQHKSKKLPCTYSKTTPPFSGELWVLIPAVPYPQPTLVEGLGNHRSTLAHILAVWV
jgi:hypothetical protein